MANHQVFIGLNPLLGVRRKDLRCETVRQAQAYRVIDLRFSGKWPEEVGISPRRRLRHYLAVEAPDDWRIGVIRSDLMIESRTSVDASKIRFTVMGSGRSEERRVGKECRSR